MRDDNRFLRILMAVEKILRAVTKKMSLFSGSLFMGLAIYMTVDVVSRRLGGPFTGFADEMSSYILALSGTWALAYALIDGRHVRIDALFHLYPLRIQHIFNVGSLFLTAGFACVVAEKLWSIAFESFKIGAKGPQSILDIPLFIPQTFGAIGFSVLAFQAFIVFLVTLLVSEGD